MKNLLKTLGPGILFASTAIGVSHLVQSTQAGANFGFTMIWAVILANLFKYPFFEYGARYANATGESIIAGYNRLGKPAIWIFFFITLLSMFLVTAAVGFVTAGFMQNLFGIESAIGTVVVIFIVCIIILISNNFKLLDGLIKVIGIILLLTTIVAFVMVLSKGPQGNLPLWDFNVDTKAAYLAFLIPFMGWMPTALDLSAWSSLWTIERIEQTAYHPTLKETKFDFNLGYLLSALLAICFVTLGAFIMFGTSFTFSASGVKFSGEIVSLYTETFGDWANIIISASAFSIMFGTCVAVFDGYSRAMSATTRIIFEKQLVNISKTKLYRGMLLIISVGSFILISVFHEDPAGFKKLITLATSISFLLAPLIALFNMLLVRKKYVGAAYVPNKIMRLLSYFGFLFLSAFTLLYLFQSYLPPL
ncbi:MAG: Nramp family divalent metal transporter [Crocinitomix sp.]|nr:Nramp family divalent metal transporter [Crocinitomix sp.]